MSGGRGCMSRRISETMESYVTPRPRKRLHIVWRRGERVRRPFRKGPSGNRGNGPLHSCNSGCTSGCGHDHVARRGHGWSAIYVQALALNGVRHEGFFVQAFARQSRARCEFCEYPYGVTPGSNSFPGLPATRVLARQAARERSAESNALHHCRAVSARQARRLTFAHSLPALRQAMTARFPVIDRPVIDRDLRGAPEARSCSETSLA